MSFLLDVWAVYLLLKNVWSEKFRKLCDAGFLSLLQSKIQLYFISFTHRYNNFIKKIFLIFADDLNG